MVFIIIFFFESNDSAPWSILRNIFWNNLSTKINKTLKDFFSPKFLKFIDLTDTDLMIFWSSSCTRGIKRYAINNWNSHLLVGNPIFGMLYQVSPGNDGRDIYATLYAQKMFFLVEVRQREVFFEVIPYLDARNQAELNLQKARRNGSEELSKWENLFTQTFL